MTLSSLRSKGPFSNPHNLEKGFRWHMNRGCLPGAWKGAAGPLDAACCCCCRCCSGFQPMVPAWGSQVPEAAAGQLRLSLSELLEATEACGRTRLRHTRPSSPRWWLGAQPLLCCALGLAWICSRCISPPSCSAWEVAITCARWQVFWKDAEWLPASSSWSDLTAVVLMRFPRWCFISAEYKQWHTMCGPRRSEQASAESNLGWIRACYGMYIDVTFVLQRCNIWIMMSWYAR